MKFKTTRKAVKENGGIILEAGYCDLQTLLGNVDPTAYTSGVYGWNADIYDIDGVIIVTGYRPFGNYYNYDLVHEYEDKARKIAGDYNTPWEERRDAVNKLLDEFINKVVTLATAK
jgi:hypothetical protein